MSMITYPMLRKVMLLEDYKLMMIFDGGEKRIYDSRPNLNHKYCKLLIDARMFGNV